MNARLALGSALLGGIVLGAAAAFAWLQVSADSTASAASRATASSSSGGSAGVGLAGVRSSSLGEARRLTEMLTKVRSEYVDEVSTEQLVDAAMRGMLTGLDPYSAYLDRREYEDLRRGAAGSYPGIGIEVGASEGVIKVLRALPASPAERAGLRSGDVILRIDGEQVGAEVSRAIEQMRGPAGSRVKLTIERAELDEIVEVTLERARVDIVSVFGEWISPAQAYVRIASFSDNTPTDFRRVIERLRSERALAGVVLDLRNNPGGVLESAVAIADDLLDVGTIVAASGRAPESRFRMEAAPGQLLEGVSVIVLINRGSASAAEILAGALQDNGRAQLMGQRTYGKGSVQSVIPFSDGRALKLTTSRYVTPGGATIDSRGIEPDWPLESAADVAAEPTADREVKLALQVLQGKSSLLPPRRTAAKTSERG